MAEYKLTNKAVHDLTEISPRSGAPPRNATIEAPPHTARFVYMTTR